MTAGQVHQRARRIRVVVAAGDPAARARLAGALAEAADVQVVAWADSPEPVLVLGTRADVCLCSEPPDRDQAARLCEHGCGVALDDGDPVAAVRAAAAGRPAPAPVVIRPELAPRQLDVLRAYVSSSDLLPTVARQVGMDPETLKTHLRRIRAKYTAAGRPAPTRRDLFVRAVEDGFLPPPTGGADR
jgi:DNA-binding CsgD family transcriptional regulator